MDDIIKIQQGDKELRKKFIMKNQGLIMNIALRYKRKYEELEDLISEGNIGLMKAIENFDPNLGFEFSTYATWWIRKSINDYLRLQTRDIRITEDGYRKMQKYHKVKQELLNKLCREPSLEEISEYSEITIDVLKAIIESEYHSASLEATLQENEDAYVEHLYTRDISVEEEYEKKELTIELQKVIHNSGLKPRQIEILVMRFGLFGIEKRTYREIGKILGNITGEAVRQQEVKALKKIRKSRLTSHLIPFLDNPNTQSMKK